MSETVVTVKLSKRYQQLNKGEVGGYPPAEAAALVAGGFGEYTFVEPPAPPAREPLLVLIQLRHRYRQLNGRVIDPVTKREIRQGEIGGYSPAEAAMLTQPREWPGGTIEPTGDIVTQEQADAWQRSLSAPAAEAVVLVRLLARYASNYPNDGPVGFPESEAMQLVRNGLAVLADDSAPAAVAPPKQLVDPGVEIINDDPAAREQRDREWQDHEKAKADGAK